ncbi:MAG: AraC family transcriptional regulator [Rhodoferax sp.]|nr:AraC family transcriptional regulator [Rhodoferax sp.]
MEPHTTSSTWLRGVASTLSAQGLDAAALFADAGLDLAALDDPDRCWPTEQISLLWRLAAERSGNPAVALMNPHVAAPAHYGVVGYAMMSSADLRLGLERLIRYLQLVSDAASISLVPQAGGRCVRLDLFGGQSTVPRQRSEYGLLTLLTFCRWMTGRKLRPLWASFSFSAPLDEGPYSEAFQCPLRFEADFNGFCISDLDLSTKLPTGIAALADLHDRVARVELDRLNAPAIAHRAQEAILKRLQDGDPRRASIASDLCLSDHTLKRRLTEEGTSFSELVDGARRELAQRYLGQRHVSLAQIAYLLGYSDQSNFFRACTRWFGESPGEYRTRLSASP